MYKGRREAPFVFGRFLLPTVAFAETGELLRHLFLFQFVQRLAIDAQRRRRASFQALDADFHAALVAESVISAFDATKGFVDLLDQLALTVPVAQFDGHVRFLAGAVVGVGKHRRFVLHRMNRTVDILAQLLLERFENFAEMRQLLCAHVVFASLGLVGSEMFVEQFFCHFFVRPSDEKSD